MLASNREFTLLLAALAIAGCLMAAGIFVAVDHLVNAGLPVAVDTTQAAATSPGS
jgi:hypothetical protein